MNADQHGNQGGRVTLRMAGVTRGVRIRLPRGRGAVCFDELPAVPPHPTFPRKPIMRRSVTAVFGLALLVTLPSGFAAAADWPQWRGPDRTGLSKETGLLKTWPKEGPALAWQASNLGIGFGTPVVAGGKVYGLGTRDKKDGVWALSEKDGTELWFTPIDDGAKRDPNNGPSGSPTVDDGKVYAM